MSLPFKDVPTLAAYLGISVAKLMYYVHNSQKLYKTFYINKDTGEVCGYDPRLRLRKICAPRKDLKAVLSRLGIWLNTFPKHSANFAYMTGRNTYMAAAAMQSGKYLIRIDMKDFFPTHKGVYIFKKLKYLLRAKSQEEYKLLQLITKLLAPAGALIQGSPTSPVLSIILNFNFDERLTLLANAFHWKYIRYADDLCFTGDDQESIIPLVNAVLSNIHPFKANPDKIDIMHINSSSEVRGVTIIPTSTKAELQQHLMEQPNLFELLAKPGLTMQDVYTLKIGLQGVARVHVDKFYDQKVKHVLGMYLIPDIKYPQQKYRKLRTGAMLLGLLKAYDYAKKHNKDLTGVNKLLLQGIKPRKIRGQIAYLNMVDPKKGIKVNLIIDKYYNKYKGGFPKND